MALSPEMQPTYRRMPSSGSNANEIDVEVGLGGLFPSGFPGFNGGVQLQNLTKIRLSVEYRSVLEQIRKVRVKPTKVRE